ncbi:hypothetical protein TNCV_2688611 [Trichonephila clavipes]|nr:hypothetical protein TNCV_2688611 [Trichonephila clavipes]
MVSTIVVKGIWRMIRDDLLSYEIVPHTITAGVMAVCLVKQMQIKTVGPGLSRYEDNGHLSQELHLVLLLPPESLKRPNGALSPKLRTYGLEESSSTSEIPYNVAVRLASRPINFSDPFASSFLNHSS